MAALAKLAQLSLVNKVTKELENHLGIADKTLSEFVIALTDENDTPVTFRKALGAVGAEVDDAFAESLLGLIQRMRKKPSGSKSKILVAQSVILSSSGKHLSASTILTISTL